MGFLDKAKSLGNKTVEEGKKYAEITKLNVTISTMEDQIKDYKVKIGTLVVDKGLPIAADDADLQDILMKIGETRLKIEEAQAKICEIKNVCVCNKCGAEVSREEKFCSKCGNSIVVVEEVKPAEPDENKCSECGAETNATMAFCSKCGKSLS